VAEYTGGRLPLFHLDLYRLESAEEILSAGIEECLQPDSVAVIEWADKLEGPNQSRLTSAATIKRVRIEILSELDRKITYDDFGA